MSSPFPIIKQGSYYTVTWPSFENIKKMESNLKLLEILFEQIKVDQAKLILVNEKLYSIDMTLWFDKNALTLNWDDLMRNHDVCGVAFPKEDQAKQLQDILEKRYLWKALKT